MRASFILNSKIRNRKRFERFIGEIEHASLFERITVHETQRQGHAIQLAEKATEKDDLVVAVGGDGTLNETLNGFMIGNQFRVGTHAPVLAYLPYGTANDFARTAKLDTDPARFIDLVERNQTEQIDVGMIRYTTMDGDEEERYFLNIADAGIGGEVVQKVNKSRTKKFLGAGITYMKAITEAFMTYIQSPVTIEADTFKWKGKLLTLACANGRYFGNGLCIAPRAALNDGRMQIIVISDISAKDYAMNIGKLRKGEQMEHPKVHYFTAKELEVIPSEYSCGIDADGEYLGNIPMHVKILPSEINFLMPHIALSDEPPGE